MLVVYHRIAKDLTKKSSTGKVKGPLTVALKSLRSKKIILFVVLGLTAFLLYLYYYVGTSNFLDVVKSANLFFYSSAFVAFLLAGCFYSLSWRSLLGNLDIKIGVRRSLLLTWAGYFFDATLPEPGWSGDITKAYILSKGSQEDSGRVVASVVGQKIISMAVTIILLTLGFGLLAFNITLPEQVIIFFGVVMTVSVGSFLVVYFMSTSFRATKAVLNKLLVPLLSFFLRTRFDEVQFRSGAEEFLSMFHKGIDNLKAEKKALVRPVTMYVLSVAFDISIVFLVFASLGNPIPVDSVLIVYALTGTLGSIGVSFIGLTEIVMTSAYQILAIPLAVSFSVTLLTRVVTLWFKLVLGYVTFQWAGIGVLLGKGKDKEEIKSENGNGSSRESPLS